MTRVAKALHMKLNTAGARVLSTSRQRLGLLQGINSAGWKPRHLREIMGSGLATEVIIDVGANHGAFVSTCRLAGSQGTIFAFEPQPEMASQIAAAGGPSTKVYTECVGAFVGTARLYRVSVGDAKASVVRDTGENTVQELEVPQTTIDQLVVGEALSAVGLLKVDAEGTDYRVLEGAATSLRSGLVRAVACEISWRSSALGVFPGDVQDLLGEFGFNRFFLTTPYFGLLPVKGRIPNYEGGTANLVALRRKA